MPRLPNARVCIIAEQIRAEIANKSSILGVFGISPDAVVLVPGCPANLQLAFMILCEAVVEGGDPEIQFEIIGPDRNPLSPRLPFQQGPLVVGRGAMVAINFQGIMLPALGRYEIRIFSMGERHSTHSFECLTPANLEERQRHMVQ
jgi:hypothetical protein